MRVRVGHAGRPAVERERDLVGAEEGIERRDDGGAVAGVRGRVLGKFGVAPSGCQLGRRRCPGCRPCRPAGSPDRGARTSSGTWRRSRRSSRRRRRRAPSPASARSARDRGHGHARGGAGRRSTAGCRGRSRRAPRSSVGRPARAVDAAEVLDLVEVVCVLPARQRVRTAGSELRCALERERPHAGETEPEHRPRGVGLPNSGPRCGLTEVWERRAAPAAVVHSQREHGLRRPSRRRRFRPAWPPARRRTVRDGRQVRGVVIVEDRLVWRRAAAAGR